MVGGRGGLKQGSLLLDVQPTYMALAFLRRGGYEELGHLLAGCFAIQYIRRYSGEVK